MKPMVRRRGSVISRKPYKQLQTQEVNGQGPEVPVSFHRYDFKAPHGAVAMITGGKVAPWVTWLILSIATALVLQTFLPSEYRVFRSIRR